MNRDDIEVEILNLYMEILDIWVKTPYKSVATLSDGLLDICEIGRLI